jgi:hypothetical protein
MARKRSIENGIPVAVAFGLLLTAVPALADVVYAGDTDGNFLEYNTLTGAYTVLGNNEAVLVGNGATVLYGLGFAGGVLYADDNAPSPSNGFYTVNTSNGALSLVTEITGAGGAGTSPGVIASTPIVGGTLYFTNSSNDIYTINPFTGAATLVGSAGVTTVAGDWDLNYGPNGTLYDDVAGTLYGIDTTTGKATLIGVAGGLEFQSIVEGDGMLYGFDGRAMYSINLTNGSASFIRNTPSMLGSFTAETPAPSTVPEPSSLPLLLPVAGFVAYRMKTRRNLFVRKRA